MKVRLQERDKRLFQYLLRYKVANLYQIRQHLQIACQRHTLQERLNQLDKAGYLQSTYFDRKKVYGLSAKSQDWLYKNALILNKFKQSHLGLSDAKLTHDILLNDVLHKLEQVKGVEEIVSHNERLLQPSDGDESQRIADALFTLKIGDAQARTALELEISLKSKSRYLAIMDTYLRDQTISLVLYLVPSTHLKAALISISKEFLKLYNDKIYFGMVDSFLNNPQACLFVSASKRTLRLSDLSCITTQNTTNQTPDSTSDTTPDMMSEVI